MAASITLFLLFAMLSANQVIAENNDPSIIRLDSRLSPKSNSTSWVSPSGHFAFGFYPQGKGFVVGIWLRHEHENITVWTAYRNSPPLSSDSVIELTKDGPVLLRDETGKRKLITNSSLPVPADSASMLDSGNFVIYDKKQSIIWQSFNLPTDTILGGQTLSPQQNLVSSLSRSDPSTGNFILVMQAEGNLLVFLVSNRRRGGAYYSYTTSGYVNLTLTGSLYLRYNGATTKVLYPGGNTSLIYRATLDWDGIFRLYVHTFEKDSNFDNVSSVWQSMNNQCEVKGFCGFNSYCSMNGSKAVCECYPGFIPINGNKSMSLDCEQRSSKDDCKTSDDPKMLYDIVPLEDVQWGLIPYLVLPLLEMEECGQSCREDCDCGAALHKDGSCRKYRLPLELGRLDHSESTTALFKLPSSTNNIPSNPKPKFQNLTFTLVITLGSISLLCLAFAISIFFIYVHKAYSYTKLSSSSENLGFAEDCSLRTFAFDELVNSTGNFAEEIGRGTFGVVYKGTIQGNNRRIAVKRLNNIDEGAEREFQAEITAIARTHHRNLVQLIGYCVDSSRKLLVYEYMSNGSLADFLFKAQMHLSWKQRVKIALDVARGLLYLHEECEVCIVHCNIKLRNILLDELWTAKISDFGLARPSMPEHLRARDTNESTSHYVAPEQQNNALPSVKVDIYSYGVVLLEIICCRRNIDVNASSKEEIMLSSWVYNCFVRGEWHKLVLDEDVERRTLERMVKVALWCVQEDLFLRPSMKNVILMLEGLKDIPIPPSPVPLT